MKKETILSVSGSDPASYRGAVNIPVYRASTIIIPNLEAFEEAEAGKNKLPAYGRYGSPTTEAVEKTVAALEGADHSIVTSSGVSAISSTLLALLSGGDHLLMPDSVYSPARRLCDQDLKRYGIETTYYDPALGAGIAALIKPNTKVVYVESPGSLTFEMQDVPAICTAVKAKNKDIVIVSDSTWGTPLFYNPFAHGVDVSIHSASKYIGGHADLIMGIISCRDSVYKKILHSFKNIGACANGDDCYLAMRGLRTLSVRLNQHYKSALQIAKWLQEQPEVEKVLYPALPGAPGHDIWKRDFSGACGLFSVVLKQEHPREKLAAMLDNMKNFHMGYSWGGFESLMNPVKLNNIRSATKFPYNGTLLRLHIGLENPEDLIADLQAGFGRLK